MKESELINETVDGHCLVENKMKRKKWGELILARGEIKTEEGLDKAGIFLRKGRKRKENYLL